MGNRNGCQVYCNKVDQEEIQGKFCNHEYLCDLVWCHYGELFDDADAAVDNDDTSRNYKCYLAMECEWASAGHRLREYTIDFLKLFDVSAPMKIFIFSHWINSDRTRIKTEKKLNDIFKHLSDVCRNHAWHGSEGSNEWVEIICFLVDVPNKKGTAIVKTIRPKEDGLRDVAKIVY